MPFGNPLDKAILCTETCKISKTIFNDMFGFSVYVTRDILNSLFNSYKDILNNEFKISLVTKLYNDLFY